ncbi:MAG: hypothetical protein ACFFD5_09650 [Candidatus Thorarchaeota archaeon]
MYTKKIFSLIMEESPEERKVVRMDQIYAVGGTFNEPSDFAKTVNRNLQILQTSDKYCNIKDIKFSIFNDHRYTNAAPIYLAFIVAEIDVDITPEPETKGKRRRKKKKKKR